MSKDACIYVAGHRGMVGSALVRRLQAGGYANILVRTHAELDLLDQRVAHTFLQAEKPDFIYQNLMMEANLIHGAHLTGPLECTNEPYAIAKIAGIKLCEAYNAQYGRQYVSVMPTNLYGPNDNYDLNNSHVLPALIRKAHEAKLRGDKELVVWGTGTPMREFLYSDDLADACAYLMEQGYDGPLVNIGSGADVTIRELAETVVKVVGFKGALGFDASKPDGTPRKLMDVSRLKSIGWEAKVALERGITLAYQDYLNRVVR